MAVGAELTGDVREVARGAHDDGARGAERPDALVDGERGVAAAGGVRLRGAHELDELHRVAGHAATSRYPCCRTVAMYRGSRHESPSFERSDRTWRSTMLLGGAP